MFLPSRVCYLDKKSDLVSGLNVISKYDYMKSKLSPNL